MKENFNPRGQLVTTAFWAIGGHWPLHLGRPSHHYFYVYKSFYTQSDFHDMYIIIAHAHHNTPQHTQHTLTVHTVTLKSWVVSKPIIHISMWSIL